MAWALPTNFSGGLEVNSLGGMMQYAQYVTNGMFAYGALVVIFMMVLMTGFVTNARKAFMAAGFVTTIFAVYFMRIEMISVPIVVFISLLFVIGAVFASREGSSAI